MKKFVSLALALLLMLTLCCACNDNSEPVTPSDPSIQEPEGPSTQEPEGPSIQEPEGPSTQEPEGPSTQEPEGPSDQEPEGPSDQEPEVEDDGWVSAVFGGGPFVTGADYGRERVSETMKSSGFNTMIIWSVHVHDDDTLYLNDIKVCDKGELTAESETLEMWSGLKEGDTGIKRVEISVGAGGCTDFEAIKSYIERDGVGKDTVLYKNFKALIEATGADAVNFDDESCYDVDSATKFGQMCVELGCKISFCPYTGMSFWEKLKNNLGENVDRVYLQCYEGGTVNSPDRWEIWSLAMKMKIIPGYFCTNSDYRYRGMYTASSVEQLLIQNSEYITGGFMWLFDDMMKLSSPNSVSEYASAINNSNPQKKNNE